MSLQNLIMYFHNNKTHNNDLNKYISILQKIQNCESELIKLRKIENRMKSDILKLCPHEWILDHSNCGEHTEHICSICGIYK